MMTLTWRIKSHFKHGCYLHSFNHTFNALYSVEIIDNVLNQLDLSQHQHFKRQYGCVIHRC